MNVHIQRRNIHHSHGFGKKYEGKRGKKTHTKIVIYKHFNKTCMLLIDCIKWNESGARSNRRKSCHHGFIVFIGHLCWPNASIISSIHKKIYGQHTEQMDNIMDNEVRTKNLLNLMLLHAGCVLGNVLYLVEWRTWAACEPHFHFW